MKGYRIYSGRKQDALELIEHTVSNPTARGVRVRAVSLNYRDLMIAWGNYPIPSDPPPIAVADGAGEVVAVGPQVTRFKVGDHVATPYNPDWIDGEPTPESTHRVPGAAIDGMLAEEIVVPEDVRFRFPPGWNSLRRRHSRVRASRRGTLSSLGVPLSPAIQCYFWEPGESQYGRYN